MQEWRREHRCRSCAEAIRMLQLGTNDETWLCSQDRREIHPEGRACPLWSEIGEAKSDTERRHR